MHTNHPSIRKIRRAANIGFYGSLLIVVLTVAEHYLSRYVWTREIVANDYTRHLLLTLGLVLSVVDIALILFTLRKQMPRLRQLDSVDDRLARYATLIRGSYIGTLVVTLVVAAAVVISHENTLIMLLLLLVITLMLQYPNMYKIRADLGLLDEEMRHLFGDAYISDRSEATSSEEEDNA